VQAAKILQSVSLVMAALSLVPLFDGLTSTMGYGDLVFVLPQPLAALVIWHHELYWGAARALDLVGRDDFAQREYAAFLVIHGTNVALGILSLRTIMRTREERDAPIAETRRVDEPAPVAIGPSVSDLLPYAQRVAVWALNAITAGVLGNYAWMLITGKI
jgi:hypothetical protein